MGFATASGKSVDVSQAALDKARKMFDASPEDSVPLDGAPRAFSGFSLGSGKAVVLDQAKIDKAKQMLGAFQENTLQATKETIEPENALDFSRKRPRSRMRKSLGSITTSVNQESLKNRRKSTSSAFVRPNTKFTSPFRKPKPIPTQKKVQREPFKAPSSLYTIKCSKTPMIQAIKNAPLNVMSNAEEVNKITSSNAQYFEYGDLNFDHVYSSMLSRGCASKYATKQWARNHYRWIVWKLASYQRSFPHVYQNILSYASVLDQMLARYRHEFELLQRSCIKQIIQKDNFPGFCMVLCVSKVAECVAPCKGCLELSDGWYSMHAILDNKLHEMVLKGKIFLGLKLIISGASLDGKSDPSTPLEDHGMVLKLSANGTRRAHWGLGLGYQKRIAFRVSLGSILPDAGIIPLVRCIVLRKYPLLYHYKGKGSKNELAQQKTDEQFKSRFESLSSILWEGLGNGKLALPLNTQLSDQRIAERVYSKVSKMDWRENGQLVREIIHNSLMDEFGEESQGHPLLKLKVCDNECIEQTSELTFWNCDQVAHLKENCVYDFYGLSYSRGLSFGKASKLQLVQSRSEKVSVDWKKTLWQLRECTTTEFDFEGRIVYVDGQEGKGWDLFISDKTSYDILKIFMRDDDCYKYVRQAPRKGDFIQSKNLMFENFDTRFSIIVAKSTEKTQFELERPQSRRFDHFQSIRVEHLVNGSKRPANLPTDTVKCFPLSRVFMGRFVTEETEFLCFEDLPSRKTVRVAFYDKAYTLLMKVLSLERSSPHGVCKYTRDNPQKSFVVSFFVSYLMDSCWLISLSETNRLFTISTISK